MMGCDPFSLHECAYRHFVTGAPGQSLEIPGQKKDFYFILINHSPKVFASDLFPAKREKPG